MRRALEDQGRDPEQEPEDERVTEEEPGAHSAIHQRDRARSHEDDEPEDVDLAEARQQAQAVQAKLRGMERHDDGRQSRVHGDQRNQAPVPFLELQERPAEGPGGYRHRGARWRGRLVCGGAARLVRQDGPPERHVPGLSSRSRSAAWNRKRSGKRLTHWARAGPSQSPRPPARPREWPFRHCQPAGRRSNARSGKPLAPGPLPLPRPAPGDGIEPESGVPARPLRIAAARPNVGDGDRFDWAFGNGLRCERGSRPSAVAGGRGECRGARRGRSRPRATSGSRPLFGLGFAAGLEVGFVAAGGGSLRAQLRGRRPLRLLRWEPPQAPKLNGGLGWRAGADGVLGSAVVSDATGPRKPDGTRTDGGFVAGSGWSRGSCLTSRALPRDQRLGWVARPRPIPQRGLDRSATVLGVSTRAARPATASGDAAPSGIGRSGRRAEGPRHRAAFFCIASAGPFVRPTSPTR